MARIEVVDPVDVSNPTLIEGFPGVGLVGKIAADHVVESFDMVHHGNVHCEDLPPVVGYGASDPALRTPVRLYADAERDLLVLQSDVPVPPSGADAVAACLSEVVGDGVTPLYLSGIPAERNDDPPAVYGVATGAATERLDAVDLPAPPEPGIVSGPTGALLARALERGTPSVGVVAESNPKFPDPAAAQAVIHEAIEPLTRVEVPTDGLVERASEIRQARERLARRMQKADADSSRAQPLGMYQ